MNHILGSFFYAMNAATESDTQFWPFVVVFFCTLFFFFLDSSHLVAVILLIPRVIIISAMGNATDEIATVSLTNHESSVAKHPG